MHFHIKLLYAKLFIRKRLSPCFIYKANSTTNYNQQRQTTSSTGLQPHNNSTTTPPTAGIRSQIQNIHSELTQQVHIQDNTITTTTTHSRTNKHHFAFVFFVIFLALSFCFLMRHSTEDSHFIGPENSCKKGYSH